MITKVLALLHLSRSQQVERVELRKINMEDESRRPHTVPIECLYDPLKKEL